jgi:hypothetical protein
VSDQKTFSDQPLIGKLAIVVFVSLFAALGIGLLALLAGLLRAAVLTVWGWA